MHDFTRRALLQGGTALATAGALTGPALLEFAKAWAQSAPWKAEPGAKLTVMRWKRFVPSEDDAFNAMVAAFKTATGTEMNVFSESFEDVQPKASVAANTGSGLDLAWGLHTLPQLFPTKALKKNDAPAGFALGHASGDANAWPHWVLWGHGAYTVDKDDKVSINSPETMKALEYCKALSDTFIPGVASWNDSSNNKAFLSGELYCTSNGISIYVAAKDDATKKELAEDTYHALWPVGPVGKPTELQLTVPILAFNFTKYPNAAKAFIAFMLEKENFDKWLLGARGYLTQTLNAYESSPVWTADPKNAVFAQASKRALPASGIGHVGEKAASAIADFIVVDMFANYCTGAKDAKTAIAEAERQLKRIYR